MESNVVPISAHRKAGLSAPTSLVIYQRIIREWTSHLDTFEFMMVMQIADRTLGWQNPDAPFSISKMVSTGDKCWGPVPMSRRKAQYALDSLEAKGMIARHEHPEGKQIKVYSLNIGWSATSPDVPNRPAACAPDARPCAPCAHPPVHAVRTGEGIEGERNLKKEDYSPSPSARGPVKNANSIRKKASEPRSDGYAADRGDYVQPSLRDIETCWQLALTDAFPEQDHCPWSVKEKGQIRQKMKKWLHAKQITFGDFVNWSVRNWAGVIVKQFHWMTKNPPPKVPTVGFFVSFIDHFAECWGEGKLGEWLRAPERTEMERLVRRGRTSEEAAAEIGKSRAVVMMRKENANAKIEVRARHRQIQLVEQRVAKMEVRVADPRSRAAQGIVVPIGPMTKLAVVDTTPLDLDPNWEPPE